MRGAIEKAAKEVEGCTFKPITTECPAYIKVRSTPIGPLGQGFKTSILRGTF